MSEGRSSESGTPEVIPPADQETESATVTVETQIEAQITSGPLPSAAELAAYEQVLPGAADRVFTMAEGFAKHKQQMESSALQQERNDRRWARIVAATVVLAVLVACVIALFLDKEEFATEVGSWTIVALAAVFIAGRVPSWIRRNRP